MSVATLANETADATSECVIGGVGFFGAGGSGRLFQGFCVCLDSLGMHWSARAWVPCSLARAESWENSPFFISH
jgi:hypothetical protein